MDSSKKVTQLRPIRPSILIGVGGTGQRIIMNVRRKIVEAYDSLDRLPIVGFFIIDTDPEKPIMPDVDEVLLSQISLNPSEFLHCTVTGTQRLKDEIRSFPELAEWLDRKILELGDVTVGAKGIRAVGRLAYFLNYSKIKSSFNSIRSKVTDKSNMDYMLKTHNIQVESGLNVYIVSSLCGGTGSGIFLDLAFSVKSWLEGTEHSRIGYFILPGVFNSDMPYGAGYAALRELNHYNLSHDFEANWEKERVGKKIQPPPFDFCYLIDNRNSRVTFSKSSDLFEMVAHNIYLEFAHEFGQYKASLKDNVSAVAGGLDKLGCPLNFMSLGLATIYFPKERVINACSYRMAKNVVNGWLFAGGQSERMDEYLAHYLDINKMFVDVDSAKKNQIRDELSLGEGNKTYYSRVDEEMNAGYASLQKLDEKKWGESLLKRDEQFVQKFYDGDKDPTRWGEFARGIFKNKEKKLSATIAKLEIDIAKMITKEGEGLAFAKQFMDALESAMSRYKDYFVKKYDELSKVESQFATRKVQEVESLKKLADRFSLNKKEVMLKQVQDKITNATSGASNSFFKRKIDKKVLELSIDFSTKVLEYLKALELEMDRLKTKMENILRRLTENEKNLIDDTSGLVMNGELLYDPSDIETYYRQFVEDQDKLHERDSISLVSSEVLRALKAENLFDLRKDDFRDKDIMGKLISVSKPFFDGVKEISVAKKFFDKYPNEQQALMALRNIFASSEVFLTFKQIPDFVRLPNSKVSLIGTFGGREGTLPEFRDLIPLLEKCCSEPGQLRGIQPIRGKNEILFTTEEGAFPLRMINEIDKWEGKYDQLSEGYQTPLHLRKGEQDYLIEVTMPSQEEQRKARVAILIGIAIGVIAPDKDDPQTMVYSYMDKRTGLKEYKPVGKKGMEEKILESILARSNKELREIIHSDVVKRLSSCGKDLAKKKDIWKAIVDYREEFINARDKQYIAERGFAEVFSSTIEDHSLFDPSFAEA
ncbi:MAG: tubulin-like doman-containing protein [Candidatus Eremiobacteraeota bacterium]|nr:tubulin-like doman-containing protein [Candidatus Eremiobacteraeota bacterium]